MEPVIMDDGQQLDSKVLKVFHAIRSVEGGNYDDRTGDGGASAGAFQWNNNHKKLGPKEIPIRFKEHALEFGLDPNDFSRANQNKVAYKKLESLKNKGFQPEEIAALWNGARKQSDGTYTYNNPEYGVKFRKALGQSHSNYNPAPFSAGVVDFSGVPRTQEEIAQASPEDTIGQSILRPFGRLAVNAIKAGQMIKGEEVDKTAPIDLPYLGATKPIGQEGTFPEQVKESLGVGTEVASTVTPMGRVAPIIRSGLQGLVKRGAIEGIGTGALAGSMYGAGKELQSSDATPTSVAGEAVIGGALGSVGGGLVGGLLPVPKAAFQSLRSMPKNIMNRVARINPVDAEKFKRMAGGKSHGQYLIERGIYGDDNEIVSQLAQRFQESKKQADEGLAKLKGNFKVGVIDDMIDELYQREQRISTKNVPSRELQKVIELKSKNETVGLDMTEINELKRLFERNVKLGYLKQMNTEAVARATNLDDTLRDWQLKKARELGFKNLDEVNKETQLARTLGDDLFKKITRSEGNNAFGLTDAILISGGDPKAIAMLLTKKTLGSKGVQSSIAKFLAPKPTVGKPEAVFANPTEGLAKQGTLQSRQESRLKSLQRSVPQTLDLRNTQPVNNREMIHEFNKFPRDKNLSPEDSKVQERSIKKYIQNKDKLIQDYRSQFGDRVVNTDLARRLFKDVGYNGKNSPAVHEASSALAKDVWKDALKNPQRDVLMYAGGSGSGKSSTVSKIVPNIENDAAAILDGNLSKLDSAVTKIQEATDAGKKVKVVYVYRDPVDSWINGVVKRMRVNKDEGGRVVPLSVFLENAPGSLDVVRKLKDMKIPVVAVDNSLGQGKAKLMSDNKLAKLEYPSNLREVLEHETKKLVKARVISQQEYEALIK